MTSTTPLDREAQLNVEMAKREQAELDDMDRRLIEASGEFITMLAKRSQLLERHKPRDADKAEAFSMFRQLRFAQLFDAKQRRDPALVVARDLTKKFILEELT